MTELHTLKKTTQKKSRRLGQGYGTARAKTAGRGTKGQKARSKVSLYFEGGAQPLTKRLPKLRGKGRNRSRNVTIGLNVARLSVLPARTLVDRNALVKYNIISKDDIKRDVQVKILGDGDLDKALTVKLRVSKNARKKIEKAGGSIS